MRIQICNIASSLFCGDVRNLFHRNNVFEFLTDLDIMFNINRNRTEYKAMQRVKMNGLGIFGLEVSFN